MVGGWYKEWQQGRRFIIKIKPGEKIHEKLIDFATETGVKNAVIISAVGSVVNVHYRGIKTGAKLPITEPRMHQHHAKGPYELLNLEGNLICDENGDIDSHLHIMMSKSSGEVLGGHLFDTEVFASCELLITEILVEGIERHASKSSGGQTIFIAEED